MELSIIRNGFITLAIVGLSGARALADTSTFKVAPQEVPTNDSKGTGCSILR
jgi:hypothetical protein